jgi:riboflavin kinase / FMN adenylyltransferase
MRIVRDLQELAAPLPGAVVTIGNFDGVHLGHREIFRRLVRHARAIDGTSVLYTFVPHPLKVLAPERAPRLINTQAEKERLVAASCIDVMICAPFDRQTANLSPAHFVEEVLVKKIGVRHLIVGYDYTFGRNREGNGAYLTRRGAELGFTVDILAPIAREGAVYSSSLIRKLLQAGEVEAVIPLLGRHFTLEGEVVHGVKRGRGLGFPTANLQTDKELIPASGVYAVKARLDGVLHDAVVNIGCNPTFGPGAVTVEAHLLDFDRQIYGRTLRLYFIQRLRGEMAFPASEALVAAIHQDIARARAILAQTRVLAFRDYLDCGLLVEQGAGDLREDEP